MLYFDVVMPLTLFAVTLASLFLNQKTEGKLKVTLEEREFSTRDAVLLVGMIVTMVFIIAFLRDVTSPLLILFMFSYSALLFIFTYLFVGKRWYVAVLPPTVFILLYAFLRDTPVWNLYLVNIYGVIFAILITLYIANLFTWKTTFIFTILLTIVDIILVLVTGTMLEAARATTALRLPVVVTLQVLPPIDLGGGAIFMSLGLGDFFFAGLYAIQTFKKYGRKLALISVGAMTLSFFIFEAGLLTYLITTNQRTAFPGTLMIICGWLAVIAGKEISVRLSKRKLALNQQNIPA
jgi:MFS family permease